MASWSYLKNKRGKIDSWDVVGHTGKIIVEDYGMCTIVRTPKMSPYCLHSLPVPKFSKIGQTGSIKEPFVGVRKELSMSSSTCCQLTNQMLSGVGTHVQSCSASAPKKGMSSKETGREEEVEDWDLGAVEVGMQSLWGPLEDSLGIAYMADVDILEEQEEQAKYVPSPSIPEEDMKIRQKVEDLMYTLKDTVSGPLTGIVDDENKWNATIELFNETVEFQNPLFCSRGISSLQEWLKLLAMSGVVIDLHDIYYESISKSHLKRWVYAIWTATLTNDVQKSLLQLGWTEWWGQNHSQLLKSFEKQRARADLDDEDGGLNAGDAQQYGSKNDAVEPTVDSVLQLSGESRFEMDESGKVTAVNTRWYKLGRRGDWDLAVARLWLIGLLNRGLLSLEV